MKGSSVVIFSALLTTFAEVVKAGDSIPDFIHPCKNISPACLKYAIQEAIPGFFQGVPELDIESLDPFVVQNLKLTLPGGIKVTFVQGVNEGFKTCRVNYARVTQDQLEFGVRCNFTIGGKYISTGRLLVFPPDGDGDAIINTKNIDIAISVKLGSKRGQDGETYLLVKSYKSSYKYVGRVSYYMTNLIKNSPELSKAVLQFMNSNWRMVAEEFGDPIMDFGMKSVMNNVKKLFNKVPLHQLISLPIR